MHFRHVLQSFFVAAAACAAANAAAATSWRYVELQAERPLEPAEFRIGADGSLWLFGIDGIRRVDAAGATTGLLASTPQVAFADAQLTRDGGAVVVTTNSCRVTRVDADVHVQWARDLGDSCVIAPAHDGGAWVANYDGELVRLGADGATLREIAIARGEPNLAAMPDGGVVVALGNGSPLVSTLTRYSSDGAQLWSLTRDGAFFAELAATADGTLTVAGGADGIILLRFGANGAPLSQYHAPHDPARSEGDFALRLAPDGSAALMSAYYFPDITQVVYRFGTDGQLAWRKDVCVRPANSYMPPGAILPLAGGETAIACSDDDQAARYLRFDASGAPVADAPLPTLTATLGLRADGTLQALGYAPGTYAMQLHVLDRDGRPVDASMPLASEPLDLVDQAFTDDGASYVLSRSALRADPQRMTLAKVDATGVPVWRRSFDVIAPLAHLSVAGGLACVAQSRQRASPWPSGFTGPPPPPPAPVSIACIASDTAVERWTRTYPADAAEHWFGLRDDGTLVHLWSQGPVHTIVRHDPLGNELSRVVYRGHAGSAAIDALGNVAAGVFDTDARRWSVVRYDPQGVAHSADVEVTSGLEVVGTVAGQAQALVGTTSGRDYRWFRADGTPAWSRSMAGLVALPVPDRDGEAVYLAERSTLSTPQRLVVRLIRLRAADGTVAWTGAPVTAAPPEPSPQRVLLAASRDQVVLASTSARRIQVARFDAHDGGPAGVQTGACYGYCGLPEAFAVDERGLARVAFAITQPGTIGATTAIVAFADSEALPAVRIDQVGLGGAWWAPYADGEGFVADWLPAARTWFMPWFTFSRDGGDGTRAEQRWYVVAGTIAEGATQATLPILETTGGTFDTGGGTTVRQVGTATLRFTDCDNGTLRYAFDAPHNDGAAGTVTLSRLSAPTQNCVLANGAVQLNPVGPVNGFDARMSGSWYEEATSGQGLQFALHPRGVFFAPWFTFDPPGSAGNPGRQRWYTLQGSLAGAVDGRVELPIVETTGGAFDSMPATRMAIVGKATLTMSACDRATLDYAFDAAAGDLAGRTGAIDLIKAGGCTP